jgi:hypothetical protein
LTSKSNVNPSWENIVPSPVEIMPSILKDGTDATQFWPNLRRVTLKYTLIRRRELSGLQ